VVAGLHRAGKAAVPGHTVTDHGPGTGPVLRSDCRRRPCPANTTKIDRNRVVLILNTILDLELAGVVRYVHYSAWPAPAAYPAKRNAAS